MEPASTSMWSEPVSGSNEVFCNLKAFGPGLIVPFRVLPSHFSSRITVWRCEGVGPQLPLHLPLRGSVALWALRNGAANVRAINAIETGLNCICLELHRTDGEHTTEPTLFLLPLSRIHRKVRVLRQVLTCPV